MSTPNTTMRTRIKRAGGALGVLLVLGVAAGCGAGGSAAPGPAVHGSLTQGTTSTGSAATQTPTTTTMLPQCGAGRDPLDPTNGAPPSPLPCS